MKPSAVVLLVLTLLAWSPPRADAQTASAAPPENSGSFATKTVKLFGKPLHPIVKSVAPGGLFGPGIGYKSKRVFGEPWSFRTEAVITPRKYWNLEANTRFQNDWLHAEFYTRGREMTRLPFYGIGPDAAEENQTTYAFLDRTAGVLSSIRLARFDVLAVGGRVEGLWPEIGPGKDSAYPPIDQRFNESTAPGLTSQPAFAIYTGFVNLNYPGGNALGRYGVDVQAAVRKYDDRDGGAYDFRRVDIESQQRVPGFHGTHKLTLHQWFSTTTVSDGKSVPFYLQQTLGGAGAVRPVGEDILGSDATTATLRGFADLRFRGPHLLLLQAEYRFKVKGPFDATLFVESGTVAHARSSLRLADMKTSFGASVSLMTIDSTALRVDVGAGREGTRLFFSVGPIFQQ